MAERSVDAGGAAEAVCAWFRSNARDLPWRPGVIGEARDPYHALVSELMLQQTQVARVVERFEAFIRRFPDVRTLARARESSVLALWSGLGYYRRARHLHAAAKEIVERHGGEVPASLGELVALKGVGEYTAGAVASIAFGRRVAAVDGNVVRVLLRVEGRRLTSAAGRGPATRLARSLVEATEAPGVLNEGLMELGATVCTPRSPRCEACPIAGWCRARKEGGQDRIPVPARRPGRARLWCASIVVEDDRGRLLVERRASSGLWSGTWQAPTVERVDRRPRPEEVADALGLRRIEFVGSFERVLTHRLVGFDVYRGSGPTGTFKTRAQIARLALATPQRRVLLEMA